MTCCHAFLAARGVPGAFEKSTEFSDRVYFKPCMLSKAYVFNNDTKTMPSWPSSFQSFVCFLYLIDGSNKQPILVEKLVCEISLHDNVSCICVESAFKHLFSGWLLNSGKIVTIRYGKAAQRRSLCTEGKFLDEIHPKVLGIFLFAIHSHLYSFPLRFIFLQTHATSLRFLQFAYCTVHCKGEGRKNW